jgi:predicted N-acetyltransferase YhbS
MGKIIQTDITPPRPLAATDDRNGFNCGRDSMNEWFRRYAWRNQESDASRTSVICDAAAGKVAGYVSLSASHIERAFLPKRDQRNRPDTVPAILLGQLAVDLDYQGRGYAGSLLFFAINTVLRLSQEMGCFAIITHPLDDAAREFYRHHNFLDLPFNPQSAMIARLADLRTNAFGAPSVSRH